MICDLWFPHTVLNCMVGTTSNAHARVDINMIRTVSVVLHRPDNNKTKSSCMPSTLDMGTNVPIAIMVMFTHIFVTCDKFVIMYNMCCVGAVMHYSTTHNFNIIIEVRNDKVSGATAAACNQKVNISNVQICKLSKLDFLKCTNLYTQF